MELLGEGDKRENSWGPELEMQIKNAFLASTSGQYTAGCPLTIISETEFSLSLEWTEFPVPATTQLWRSTPMLQEDHRLTRGMKSLDQTCKTF